MEASIDGYPTPASLELNLKTLEVGISLLCPDEPLSC
jgi:hypothetical protein